MVHTDKRRALSAARGLLAGRDEGSVTVLVAVLMVAFLGMAGLAVDAARGHVDDQRAQEAVDAAALAGAEDLLGSANWSTVIADVQSYASADFNTTAASWAGCSDPLALSYHPDAANNDTCISSDSATAPTLLRVKLPPQALATTFGKVLGVSSFSIAAGATAKMVTSPPCALCILSSTANPGLKANGNGIIDVSDGTVIVNSVANTAASVIGNATVTATGIGGPAAPNGFITTGNGSYSPTPKISAAVQDPFAGIAECPAAGTAYCPTTTYPDVKLTGNGAATIQPGIYGTISAQSQSSLTMEPGTYIITNSMVFSGSGTLTANGVTLYFACSSYPTPCSPGQPGATFSITGNGTTTISAPTSGTFQGLTIFADRNNAGSSSLTGNGSVLLAGTVYAPSTSLTVTGNAGTSTLDSMIVSYTCTASGNGTILLNYTSSQNAPVALAELSQ